MRRPRFRGFEIGYRGDFLEPSRADTARYWRLRAKDYASALGRFGVGALSAGVGLAASALRNFSVAPKLDSSPIMSGVTKNRSRGRLGRRGGSRFSAASGVVNMEVDQPRRVGDVTPYMQITQTKVTRGKGIPKTVRFHKVVGSICQPLVTRFQRLSTMEAANGNNYLNYVAAVANGGSDVFPVYAFDLTGTINSYNNGASIRYPAVMYRLHRTRNDGVLTDVGNRFYWDTLDCSNSTQPDGTSTAYSWLCERKPRANCYPIGRTFFDWIDARFMIFGATTKPVSVTIALASMDEVYGPPGAHFGSLTATTDTQYTDPNVTMAGMEEKLREVNEYWMGFTDRLVSNPLNKRDAYNIDQRKGVKIYDRKTFDIAPTSNFESDTRGHIKMYRYFKRLNRIVNYQNERSTTLATTNAANFNSGLPYNKVADPNVWDSEGWTFNADDQGQRYNTHAKARLYILVYANSPVSGAGASASHASFDFCIRRKQTVAVNN